MATRGSSARRADTPSDQGFGVAASAHLVPFHTSPSVTWLPLSLRVSPTAVQADELAQATASSGLVYRGDRVRVVRQAFPFHASARRSQRS
jgi:hypothetical protein